MDFYDLSLVRGAPPHVIWLHLGNADKATVLRKLTEDQTAIAEAFEHGLACVELGD